MQCIGDECSFAEARAPDQAHVGADSPWRLLPYLAIVMASAGIGYASAPSRTDESGRHLAAIAPPVVMVSELSKD